MAKTPSTKGTPGRGGLIPGNAPTAATPARTDSADSLPSIEKLRGEVSPTAAQKPNFKGTHGTALSPQYR